MQWLSLCLLCCGVGLVQASSVQEATGVTSNSVLGLAAVIAACGSSGLAGVYFEMVLKNAKTSLWVRNIQLSLFGVLLGLVPVVKDWGAIQASGSFFFGYNEVVWAVVLLQAGGGLLVAVVVKYADNILKGFATSLSIIFSCVASYFLFGFVVNGRFVCGAALVLYSVYMYGSNQVAAVSSGSSSTAQRGDRPSNTREEPEDDDEVLLLARDK